MKSSKTRTPGNKVIFYGVLKSNTDVDIIRALRVQNKHLMREVAGENDRIEIKRKIGGELGTPTPNMSWRGSPRSTGKD